MKNDSTKGASAPTPTQLRNQRALALVKEMFGDRELAKIFFRTLADRAAVGAEFHGKHAHALKEASKLVGVMEMVSGLTQLERSAETAGAHLLIVIDQMEKVNAKN